MGSGLFYALVHFVIGMLEACLLQDLSMTARRVLLAVITPMAIALGIYFVTPPVILQYCDDRASSTHNSTEIAVIAELRDRLQILDQKKYDLERTVWGRRRNAFVCSIMSLPRSYAAVKLLCAYNTVSHDLRRPFASESILLWVQKLIATLSSVYTHGPLGMRTALHVTLFASVHLLVRALETRALPEMNPLVGAGALMFIFAAEAVAIFIYSRSPTVVLESCENIYQEACETLAAASQSLKAGQGHGQRYNQQLTHETAQKTLEKLDADMGDMIIKIRALHRNRTLRAVRALPWTWEAVNLRDALRDAREDTRSLCPPAHQSSQLLEEPSSTGITGIIVEAFKRQDYHQRGNRDDIEQVILELSARF
ncbi:hypothetical protein GGG16DRAFT_99298 [Schizophyllum commune]